MRGLIFWFVMCLATFRAGSAFGTVHYVNPGSSSPTPPYTNWVTAATNIQNAIDAAISGDVVLVTNGIYQTGGRIVFGSMSNRVVIDKAITVQSVNGPAVTLIRGNQAAGTTNGDNAVRCVNVVDGASLIGFTLTNGATRTAGDVNQEQCGGGFYASSTGVIVSNCVISGNSAYAGGGGGLYATINNCTFVGNFTTAVSGTGGAANSSTLNSCLLFSNTGDYGGATYACTLNNCTVVGNTATSDGGGVYIGTVRNSIVYFNSAPSDSNYYNPTITYSCSTPLPGGAGNIVGPPLFVDQANANFHEANNSPCINAGNNSYALTAVDLDGNPRVFDGTADMGAYEFQSAHQTVYYVRLNSTNPVSPYTSWATAATDIQSAIDAATPGPGSLVLVSNGIYQTGGRIVFGSMSNRVAINKAIAVQSVNGPAVTIIRGNQVAGTTNGDSAIRCAYLVDGASLIGFTLTNGATRAAGDVNNEQCGGGFEATSTSAIASNCVISGNSACAGGGGALYGTFNNCTLIGNFTTAVSGTGGAANSSMLNSCLLFSNTGDYGGGAYSCTLNNCTVVGNTATSDGGGVYIGTVRNSIIYFNSAPSDPNYYNPTITYSCSTPLPGGAGNIVGPPLFVDQANANFHEASNSPCIDKGTNSFALTASDLDGNPRIFDGTVDMGAYEVQTVVPLAVTVVPQTTNSLVGFSLSFTGWLNGGTATNTLWDFGDGTTTTNTWNVTHAWNVPGDFSVVLTAFNPSHPSGISATSLVHVVTQVVYYVSAAATNAISPYNSWSTAATNIQDAVDAALPASGSLVLVSNGVYATGGRIVSGSMSNRVVIDKPIRVQSVNGAGVTFIRGKQVPGTTNGNSAVRCVYFADGALLAGFTLTNGATRTAGDVNQEQCGGGFYASSTGVIVSNCVISGNSAYAGGGGGLYATINNCTFVGNFTTAVSGTGGAANSSTLNSCLLFSNTGDYGGATYACTLNNCTVVGNTATSDGGGVYIGTVRNSIVYFNSAPSDSNYYNPTITYSCSTPLPGGAGNIVGPPLFVDQANANFHEASNSPCIDKGTNSFALTASDLDGNPRLIDGTVDIGAYEFQTITPLIVSILPQSTNLLVQLSASFTGSITSGMATNTLWDFGDGIRATNTLAVSHAWSSPGDFSVVLTAFNSSFPSGVTATSLVHVATQITYFVSANATNPVSPYSSWATAATKIQDAVDVALPAPGSLVLVSNGVYAAGGRVIVGAMTNRVAINKPITVQSVHGAAVTTIQGYQVPGSVNGDGAVRCVYLADGASLSGFTLTNGATRAAGNVTNEQCGGGVEATSTNAIVSNCVLSGNSAYAGGGAALNGTLNNCSLSGNSTTAAGGTGGAVNGSTMNSCLLLSNSGDYGGAAYGCTLNNCTVVGNIATSSGGGAYLGTVRNSIVYLNSAPAGPNYFSTTISYSCSTPLPAGTGNIVGPPVFVDAANGDFHVTSTSPTINLGNTAFALTSADLDGNSRVFDLTPDMGAYEFQSLVPLTVTIQPGATNLVPGYVTNFSGAIGHGFASSNYWDFDDGTIVNNNLNPTHSWSLPGDYFVKLWAFNADNLSGVSATVTVHVAAQLVYYVNQGNTNPIVPYVSWATAATSIQDAIDSALASTNSLVLVSNGVYQRGGRVIFGAMSNRVAVTKPVRVQSLSGPDVTVIQGFQVPGATNGDAAIRCVYLKNGAVLSGFTLTNGATRAAGDPTFEVNAGGVLCEPLAVVSNCVLTGNAAYHGGGGGLSGTFDNCRFIRNTSMGGAGGGALSSTLNNCSLFGNSAGSGGAASSCVLNNCTAIGNSASAIGGGTFGGTLNNDIVYSNSAPIGPNYSGGTFSFSCTTPLPAGSGNITNSPAVVDPVGGDLHLQNSAPCINAGNNSLVVHNTDLDGNPRVAGGTVDIGAYEFQNPASIISYAWLQQFGLTTDGSADFADTDGDGLNNWQEWRAGTVPTNAASVLKILSLSNSVAGATIQWQSVGGINYILQRSTNLIAQPAFSTLRSNIAGQPGTTSLTDTNTAGSRAFFYRIVVP